MVPWLITSSRWCSLQMCCGQLWVRPNSASFFIYYFYSFSKEKPSDVFDCWLCKQTHRYLSKLVVDKYSLMPSVGSGCETCCLGPRTAGTTVHLFFPLPGFRSASGRRVSCTLWLVICSEHGFQGIWGLVLWGCSAPLDDGLNNKDGWGN